jgi:peptide/nickel transport system permease protein
MVREETSSTDLRWRDGQRKRKSRAWVLMHRNKPALLSTVFLILIILCGLFAPWLTRHDALFVDLSQRLRPPVWQGGTMEFPLGTDQMGRDVLSRMILGSRVSLMVGISAVLFSTVLGVVVGLLAGFYPNILGTVLMRLVDIQLSFPPILVAMALVVVLRGKHGVGSNVLPVVLVLGLAGWVIYARVVRSQVLTLSQTGFVVAARSTGCKDLRIVLRHFLPNLVTPIIVLSSLQVATVIIDESILSFLGVGIQPPTPTWGNMLADGKLYLRNAWWLATLPGLAIFLTVLSINFIGDWVRDTFDPYMTGRFGS